MATPFLDPTLVPLAALQRLARNPKRHDLPAIRASFGRFGFLQRIIINQTTGVLIAGHGRIDALALRREAGEGPPPGVEVDSENGDWLIPADLIALDAEEQEAAAIALNRIGEGAWDEAALAEVLADLADTAAGLEGTGFTDSDLNALQSFLALQGGDSGLPDLPEYEPPPGQPRVIVICDSPDERALLCRHLGLSSTPTSQVTFHYRDTKLGQKGRM